MFLFLKLYLAHLIGDFILQFEELYQLKVRSIAGHIFHVLIHAAVSFLLVMPFLGESFLWFFIPSVTVIHLCQDLAKYNLQKKFPSYRFPLFVGDQIFHFLVVASVLLFPQPDLTQTLTGSAWNRPFYVSDIFTLCLIMFIIVTFAGSYLLHSFRLNYIPDTRPDHFITPFEMCYEIVERTFISVVFLFAPSPFWMAASALIGTARLAFPKMRNRLDFTLSFAYAAACGLIFRNWLGS